MSYGWKTFFLLVALAGVLASAIGKNVALTMLNLVLFAYWVRECERTEAGS